MGRSWSKAAEADLLPVHESGGSGSILVGSLCAITWSEHRWTSAKPRRTSSWVHYRNRWQHVRRRWYRCHNLSVLLRRLTLFFHFPLDVLYLAPVCNQFPWEDASAGVILLWNHASTYREIGRENQSVSILVLIGCATILRYLGGCYEWELRCKNQQPSASTLMFTHCLKPVSLL